MTHTKNSVTKKDTNTRQTDWTLHDSETARVNTALGPLLHQLSATIYITYIGCAKQT